MTVPRSGSPLRTVSHSKTLRTSALVLLVVLDVLILVWMSSTDGNASRFFSARNEPIASGHGPGTGDDHRAGARSRHADMTSSSGRPAQVAGGDRGADDARQLMELLGGSSSPTFMDREEAARPARQPRPGSQPRRSPLVADRNARPPARRPSARGGTLAKLPADPTSTYHPLPPAVAPSSPAPGTTAAQAPAAAHAPRAAGAPSAGAPATRTREPPRATSEPVGVAAPPPGRTRTPQPAAAPVPDVTPSADPTPDVIATSDAPTEGATSSPTPTGRATNAPSKCTQAPCRP